MNNFKDPEKYLKKVLDNWDAFNKHHAQLTNAIKSILAENKMLRKKMKSSLSITLSDSDMDMLKELMTTGCIKTSVCEPNMITNNYERIKAMSIEEMAQFICGIYDEYDDKCNSFEHKFINGTTIPFYCETNVRGWLESEVE